ncbi:D-alanyl-D-alanine carboxypeptidase/D-alanyl-D-alanine endopeptidase [Salmonirosea aquatica]|uniref:D-alanyl-D-alanine carboxypeptidase/D-alanyl-D-alanine-endopeptidase n=1 Tax=Salmonirosea aquatica TaxID=2654236 RepID=A0A7C9BM89_9BACT|nr:D-alanyl-D-alanine carboxypeptidase/D-alanyl-D-alanine-endopeptidase [Cytophagaceae bacterium SJW1-29]
MTKLIKTIGFTAALGRILISGILFYIFSLQISTAQRIDSLGLGRLADAVIELQNSELMRNGTLAFCLKSTRDGRTILGLNQEQSLPSASTLKLVSTATVLSLFGGDYTYKTYLEYDGQLVGDTLLGNLYIRGTGDPSLGSDRFEGYPDRPKLLARWTAAVRKAGIRYIRGQVAADPTFFDDKVLADTWVWGDLGNYYGAGVHGLNFGENLYRVSFRAGRDVGDPTQVLGIDPELPYLTLANQVTTGEAGSGDQVYIYTSPLGNAVQLTGTVPRGAISFAVKGAVPNPAYAVAFGLNQTLKAEGVGVAEEPRVLAASGAIQVPRTVLDQYDSPTLRELCQQTNWWSINLYADAFLKTSGQRLSGKASFDDAAKAEAAYWRTKGADMRGFYIKDGSGLSPTGSLTAQNLSEVLNAATKDKTFTDFYNSIAILGKTGTVRNIGKRTKAAGNVRAKSGSIEGTRAYAGYVVTQEGERLSFAMIAHKYLPDTSGEVSRALRELLVLLGEL